jgi:hypothetical protein
MALTTKDKEFLNRLRALLDEKQLRIELKQDGVKRLVLRQNYGDKIDSAFGVTRQGVRWRFNHIFNDIYVDAFCAILLIESDFGTEIRHHAIAIARERVDLYKKAKQMGEIHPRRRGATEK